MVTKDFKAQYHAILSAIYIAKEHPYAGPVLGTMLLDWWKDLV